MHLLYLDVSLPAHSGGLFLSFMEEIIKNNFSMPIRIPYYTEGGIPFAYPPLPFYIGAIILKLTHIHPYTLINVLSPFTAVLTLPAVYAVANTLTTNKKLIIIMLAVFVFLPSTFREQIDDEGFAEALGTLALLLLLFTLFKTQKNKTYKKFSLIGINAAFCVLVAPGSAYAAGLILATYSIFHVIIENKKTDALKHILLALVLTIVLTSVYWYPVIQHHGLNLFIESFSGQHPATDLSKLITDLLQANFSRARYPIIWNGLLFAGLLSVLYTKRAFWVLWLVLLYLIPGEGGWLASIPASFIISHGIWYFYEEVFTKRNAHSLSPVFKNSLLIATAALFVGYVSVNVQHTSKEVRELSRPNDSKVTLQASKWIQQYSAPDENIIILASHLREWTPRLMQRTVLNVPQGTEWEPETAKKIEGYNAYIGRCNDHHCLAHAANKYFNVQNFIVYLHPEEKFAFLNDNIVTEAMHYEKLYDADGVLIGRFARITED